MRLFYNTRDTKGIKKKTERLEGERRKSASIVGDDTEVAVKKISELEGKRPKSVSIDEGVNYYQVFGFKPRGVSGYLPDQRVACGEEELFMRDLCVQDWTDAKGK